VGLAGSLVFVRSYAPAPDDLLSFLVTSGAVVVVVAALLRLFWRPRWLGSFLVPRTRQILVYLACVVGELALIRIGSLQLEADGHSDARPALIAAVVGLHFIPFAWAFGERMFYVLGTALVVLGCLGLALQLSGQSAGGGDAVLLLAYASGVFARPATRPDTRPDARSAEEPPAS
jgi:hypothetical protein